MTDLRLRLAGFRRYAATVERQLQEAFAGRGLAGEIDDASTIEWQARARQYEFYWGTAHEMRAVMATRPFGAVAARVLEEGRTFLAADRLYTLWQAVTAMPAAARAVAEVGVFKGGSARLIGEAL